MPASAKATWPKRSETDSLSSGTLVDVSHRRRGAAVEAVAAAAEAAEAALPPAAEESVVHARRELEARAGTR